MNNEENTQGNPEAVDNIVSGSEGDDFFSALEDSVNSMVQEPEKPETQTAATPDNQGSNQTVETEASVSQSSEGSELDNLKKRYSDSSREAQNLRAQLNELKPFVPVLDAMKRDNGLVNHVRDYFQNGGQVNTDMKKQLKLDDDFQFDPDEMISNPNSDSRKVFDNMVNNLVNQKANEIVAQQTQQAQQYQQVESVKQQAAEFMKRHQMTEDEFRAFANEAQENIRRNGITLEDMYTMFNKSKVSKNVADATKKDMLDQMKNVRNMPSTASGANSSSGEKNADEKVFDALLGLDSDFDNLFG